VGREPHSPWTGEEDRRSLSGMATGPTGKLSITSEDLGSRFKIICLGGLEKLGFVFILWIGGGRISIEGQRTHAQPGHSTEGKDLLVLSQKRTIGGNKRLVSFLERKIGPYPLTIQFYGNGSNCTLGRESGEREKERGLV